MTNQTWNLPPPPGFQGLHPEVPVTFYFRHLPHWRQDGATYFVTFRLADSLPQVKLRELEALKREFLEKRLNGRTDWQSLLHTERQSVLLKESVSQCDWDQLQRLLMRKVEKWLDQGMGACWLKRRDASQAIIEALHHFDDERYELGAYVVMPNHVHLIVRPLCPREQPLEKILQSRKNHTSLKINRIIGRRGILWQQESFDRIIRDEEHLWRCIQYIGRNPATAGLSLDAVPRWIRPSWVELGWTFETPER